MGESFVYTGIRKNMDGTAGESNFTSRDLSDFMDGSVTAAVPYNSSPSLYQQYFGEGTMMGDMLAPNGTSGVSKLGSLAGAAGSLAGIWGAYEGVKAAKDANKLKKEQYEYLKSRDAKSDAFKAGLASTFANAYQGPSYNKYTPTVPAAAPIKL